MDNLAEKQNTEVTKKHAFDKIFKLENALLAQADCLYMDDMEYNHWFADGLYGREIKIPANIVLTTMIHASDHIAILSSGSMSIYTEAGLVRVEAPYTMITKIGTKRAIITHSDVVFTTIHSNPDNLRDVNKLVDLMTFKTEQDYLEYQKSKLSSEVKP